MRRLASTTIALMALLLAMLAVAPGVSAQATVDPECGCFVGYATVRSSIEVGQDGQSFAGPIRSSPWPAWPRPWVSPWASSVRAR